MKRHGLGVLASAGLLFGGGSVFAQEPVVGVGDPDALFHSSDPKLDANKQVAYHILRDILEAGRSEAVDRSGGRPIDG